MPGAFGWRAHSSLWGGVSHTRSMPSSVVVFATRYPPAFRGGGPIRTLEALARTVPSEYDVRVITRDDDEGSAPPLPVEADVWTQRDGVSVRYVSVSRLRSFAAAMASARQHRPEMIYVNSFFDFALSIAPQLLRRIGYLRAKRVLLAPRGEFGAAAYASKSRKKKLFIALYRALGLHRGVVWHASSVAEKADIEHVWGEGTQVVVRENDTLLPALSDRSVIDAAAGERPLSLVSLGRLVDHKGLHLVLEGLADASSPIDLDVYGPAEDEAYVDRCKSVVRSLNENVTVRFHDAVPHDRVRELLAGHDALVMPTAGENFGHVIAEALSVACPVICSDRTPWTRVLRSGGGVVVDERTAENWRTALLDYATLNAEGRAQRRYLAADAYDEWRGRQSRPHVFELLQRSSTS